MPAWFDELAEFLRIQSISADTARAEDVRDAGEWVCGPDDGFILADGPLYAAACRWIKQHDTRLLETWPHRLGLGERCWKSP